MTVEGPESQAEGSRLDVGIKKPVKGFWRAVGSSAQGRRFDG